MNNFHNSFKIYLDMIIDQKQNKEWDNLITLLKENHNYEQDLIQKIINEKDENIVYNFIKNMMMIERKYSVNNDHFALNILVKVLENFKTNQKENANSFKNIKFLIYLKAFEFNKDFIFEKIIEMIEDENLDLIYTIEMLRNQNYDEYALKLCFKYNLQTLASRIIDSSQFINRALFNQNLIEQVDENEKDEKQYTEFPKYWSSNDTEYLFIF